MKFTVQRSLLISWAVLIAAVSALSLSVGAALAVVVLAVVSWQATKQQQATTWDQRVQQLDLALQAKLDAQNAQLAALVDKFTQLRADEAVARAQFTQVPRLRG